ncbi:MAG TPA: LCP family protein, partial [Verrucomicrobiae bacterium]|nr:LCP family protein [Verrucomicrobiae bacterium]
AIIIGAILLLVLGLGGYLVYNLYGFSKSISTSGATEPLGEDLALPPMSLAELNRQDYVRDPGEKTPDKNLNILVVGVDNGTIGSEGRESYRDGVGRTDTIMVFSINRDTRQISLISVPRDSYVYIPGRGMDKVNHAHAFGGMPLSIATLSKFLGINIDHYVKFNYAGFIKAVDTLEGVTVDVDADVKSFIDGKVKIPKGVYHMDGKMAFDFVHFREWDIPRIRRQQQFVQALAAQHLGIGSIRKVPKVLDSISGDIETNLSPKEMLELALEMPYMNTDSILAKTVPGKPETIKGISYWLPDPQGTKQVVSEIFR